jgi:hypothetical protein
LSTSAGPLAPEPPAPPSGPVMRLCNNIRLTTPAHRRNHGLACSLHGTYSFVRER